MCVHVVLDREQLFERQLSDPEPLVAYYMRVMDLLEERQQFSILVRFAYLALQQTNNSNRKVRHCIQSLCARALSLSRDLTWISVVDAILAQDF